MISNFLVLLPLLAPQAPPPDLGRVVDGACHWLRWRGRNPDGSYGKGALETAAALAAFAESPRAYREIDGPWIRDAVAWLFARQAPDGPIGVEEEDRGASTALAVGAFRSLEIAHHGPERERAEAFLKAKGISADDLLGRLFDGAPPVPGSTPEEARKAAEPFLAGRGSEGDWNGSVRETSRAAIFLSRCQKAILAGKKPGPAPPAAPPPAPKEAPSKEAIGAAIAKGASFLMGEREKDGLWGFGGRSDPGISGLCAAALLSLPTPRSKEVDEAIAKALSYLADSQDEDGAVSRGGIASYVTSVAIQAWVLSGEAKVRGNVERGQAFLKRIQADEGEGYSKDDRFYGGIGYGDDERPDLSNLNYALDALVASGLPKSDPAFANALVFLQRCQNRSESNGIEVKVAGDTIVAGNDGGASYFPGNSPAGTVALPDGRKVARSYGSMTYALLKGFLFAGLSKTDPRVQAAFDWVRKNWTLEENPGFDTGKDPRAGYQGYYYYLHTAARTLRLFGEEAVRDAAGASHDWKGELAARLLSLQRPDGSWKNDVDRWWEGHEALVTAYAILTLRECR
ncbi:MAG TPA: prenyltransferase/squalene oxidase repeat-containing protein [Planctomycetota bacterium]|jgi:squalene-hopene/tetraprenyl-beta-curcumene cyclase|nr:prenyltransferase/squalene oxidase repeat-containing protein [Planctomycetota bacterium]